MKKNLFFLAALGAIALTSCTNDEFIGENSPNKTQTTDEGAILFGSKAGNITRATSNSGSVQEMLDGQMKIFGVKKTNPSTYVTVFDDYQLWYDATETTSNPDGDWEYVGATGTHGSYVNSSSVTVTPTVTLSNEQYIKYWDYATNEYHFVAGSPVSNFTYNLSTGEIGSATVTGIAGHLTPNTGAALVTNPVYVADPVKKVNDHANGDGGTGTNYNTEVEFSFTRQQSLVRVGVFETIPGYSISAISFYEWDYSATKWNADAEASHHVILNSKTDDYFGGASNATATVTYDWSTTPAKISSTAYASGVTYGESWYGGVFASGVPATASTEATIANLYGNGDSDLNATTGFFTVVPTASGVTAQPIIVKCDYTLTALDGSETINVKGATAAIPAAFCKWNPNTSYTYLFKISDNTNGTTGTPGTDPEGLFPITFDAVVVAQQDGTNQGTITTVSTPSITTYQVGSVTASGIQYTTAKGAIYFTAQNDETGELNTLTARNDASPAVGMVQVYKLAGAATEADLIETRPATDFTTTIGAAALDVNGLTIAAGNWASFTPDAAGYYAIEYRTATGTPGAFAYKVVHVE